MTVEEVNGNHLIEYQSADSSTYGILLFAVLLLSTDALLVLEVSDLNEWSLIFMRYWLMGLTILLYFFITEREKCILKFYNIGYLGIIASFFNAASGICYVFALLNTHVANVMVIMATNAIFAAIFSYLIFAELVPLRTIITMAIIFTSVTIIIALELTADFDNNWFGNFMAVLSALFTALYYVMVGGINKGKKVKEEIDLIPCLILAAIIEAVIATGAGAFDGLQTLSDHDLIFLMLQGIIVLPLGSALLTYVTKYISAPEVTLFMLLDTIIEPIWVYLAGLDTPPYYTIYCGIVVILALATNSYIALTEEESKYDKIIDQDDTLHLSDDLKLIDDDKLANDDKIE
jgi:drug/metabolite transporter (DMT)-like permease